MTFRRSRGPWPLETQACLNMTCHMSEPTSKEQFDLLYERLKFYHDSAIDAVFKVTASLLVVIGWVTTSDSARKTLATDGMLRWCASAAVVLLALQFIAGAWRSASRSHRITGQLDDLAYMPTGYYGDLLLHRRLTLAFVIMNSALSAIAIILILRSSTWT